MRARARALRRRPQAGRQRAAAPAQARRDAQPDHHRRAQVRDDEHPPLPRASPRDPDVEAEGAQLLRRGAQLGPRPRLVPRPLRRALRGARRVLAPLHEPAPLPGRRRADPPARPRRQADLHGPRPDLADPLPLVPTPPARATRRGRWRSPRPPRPGLRHPLDVLAAAPALSRALRPLPDRGDRPGGAPVRPRGDDAQGLPFRRGRRELHLRAVRPRVGEVERQGIRALPVHGEADQAAGFRSFDRNFDRFPEPMRWMVEKVVHDPEAPPAPKPELPGLDPRPPERALRR